MAAGGEKLPTELLQGPVSDRLLAAHPPLLGRAPARSVPDGGADRAGVDLHRGRQVGGERLRPDAAAAVDRPAVRANGSACARFSLGMLTTAGHEHQDGHGLLRRPGAAVRRGALRAGQLQRRARAGSPRGSPSGRAFDRDEFIDDIPFPETQNYVKRILGTAEDYRRLYGPGGSAGRGPTRSRCSGRSACRRPAPKRRGEGDRHEEAAGGRRRRRQRREKRRPRDRRLTRPMAHGESCHRPQCHQS